MIKIFLNKKIKNNIMKIKVMTKTIKIIKIIKIQQEIKKYNKNRNKQ